eukprot:15083646-Alexandrium_andersonii.AAC.1
MAVRSQLDNGRPDDAVPISTWMEWRKFTEERWAYDHPRMERQEVDGRCRAVLSNAEPWVQRLVLR